METSSSQTTDPGAGGAGKPVPSFWETFEDAGLKAHPSVTKFTTPEALAKSYVDAEKRLGAPPDQLIRLPTKPDDKAAWDEVYSRLGRPEKADGYGIKLPENATEEMKAVSGKLAETAHIAGLSPAQLRPLVDLLQAEANSAQTQAVAARETETRETQATLRKEWGAKFDVYGKEIGKLVVDLGGQPLLDELNASGLGNSLALNRALAKLVDRVAEPERPGGEGGRADVGDRPFTPAQAGAERARLEADPTLGAALRDRSHAQHKHAVDERNRLLALENPRDA